MNKMKRVLIFSLVYYPRFIGGAEVAIKEITDRLPENNFEFHMVTLRLDKTLPKEEKIGNVLIHRVGFTGECKDSADSLRFPLFINKYFLTILGFFKARTLHRQYKFDAIWSMMASYNGFAAMFFKYNFPKVPYILSLQEGDPIDYIKGRVGILYFLYKRIFTKADVIQTISNYLADFARSMGYKGGIEVIPNGVDTKHFEQNYLENELLDLKNKLNKKDGDIFIITTSRLVVKNAVGDIIKALSELPENIKFIILGQGYEENSLKKLVKEIRVEERVQFLGYVSHEEMPKYLKVSDVFIRPSISEGFGNSFIEAMAAGLPVVATPVGGIVDFLKDGETGLFCKVQNPESIAEQVKKLIDNPELKNKLVENASRMVKDKYEWDLVAKDMKERVF